MQTNRITQNYWKYRVEPIKPADKPRREKQKFMQVLKKQATEEKITEAMITIVLVGLFINVVVQVLIAMGKINAPVYL